MVVFAAVQNEGHLLRPGVNCRVHVSLPEVIDALVIPLAAVANNSGTPVVTIIRDGKAYVTEVESGMKTDYATDAGTAAAVDGFWPASPRTDRSKIFPPEAGDWHTVCSEVPC